MEATPVVYCDILGNAIDGGEMSLHAKCEHHTGSCLLDVDKDVSDTSPVFALQADSRVDMTRS